MTVVAVVALAVAALGITNTMLMGVLERVREIGIMKAVGARDGHIQMMFMVEGAVVGVLGCVHEQAPRRRPAWKEALNRRRPKPQLLSPSSVAAKPERIFLRPTAFCAANGPAPIINLRRRRSVPPKGCRARVSHHIADREWRC